MNNILIGTNVFGTYKRQDLAIESFCRLKSKNTNVDICLIQEPSDQVNYDLPVYPLLKRNSSNIYPGKNLPFVTDIFDILADKCKHYFVFCNSDIILSQALIDHINETDIEAQGISRIDIPEINKLTDPFVPIRMEPSGFDCWIVQKQWWLNNRHLFHDFLLGRPYFDVHMTLLMMLHSKNLFISNQYLIYHIFHDNISHVEDSFRRFNNEQMLKYYKQNERIWGDIANNTFLKRKDYGRFLKFNNNELDIIQHIKETNIK